MGHENAPAAKPVSFNFFFAFFAAGSRVSANTPAANGIPACEHCPAPKFPADTPAGPLDARVLLQVTVKTDGLAYDAAVLESPGEAYSERALQAVKGWKFRPAHDKDGNPVSVRASIEVRFRRLR